MVKAGLITGIIGIVLSIVIPLVVYAGLRGAGNKLQQEAERLQREAERRQQQQPTTAPTTAE
jgi:type II secretory pathway pseudopilin PulG